MLKKLSLTAAVAATLLTAGCGGSSSSESSSSGGTTPARYTVSGPLSGVQSQISGSVLTPVANAAAGTPLHGVVTCADAAVNGDTLNIVNALANGVQNAAATQNPQALAAAAPQVQGSIQQLALDLQQLLAAMAGGAGCTAGASQAPAGTNPLAGSPLAAFGATLTPVLANITQTLGVPTGAGGTSPQQSLAALSTVLSTLSGALDSALLQAPPQATGAPVLGGTLLTLQTALHDLITLLNTASSGSAASTTLELQHTLNDTLLNVLLKIVPVSTIESQSGQPGLISTPVTQGVAQLSNVLAQGLGTVLTPVLTTALTTTNAGSTGPLAPLGALLPSLLSSITGALKGAGTGGSTTDPTAALANVLFTLSSTLTAILGSTTTTGTGTTTTPCIFLNTPLSGLCKVLGG